MNESTHLSDEVRQRLADGSLDAAATSEAQQHLDACDACRSDVVRLSRIVSRARELPKQLAGADDLWPEIREGIERARVVEIGGSNKGVSRKQQGRIVAAVAAATIVGALGIASLRNRATVGEDTIQGGVSGLTPVADSTTLYQSEAQALLGQLELRRALLRPETAASIDKNLATIDTAIAELKDAIAHDPSNAALRQLLASSYRQKVELLKRVGNAG